MTEPAYTPDLPACDWARIREFTVAVTNDVAPKVPYAFESVINAVAHHVDWCANIAGFPLDRDTLFRRDVIAYAVDNMPTSSPSTRGRRRSLMFRVGEQLGIIEALRPVPPLRAAEPSQPYSAAQILELSAWAEYQNSADRRHSALALIALGLGAGLPTRDLCAVRASDISTRGTSVQVGGGHPRTVPIGENWAPVLAELADSSTGRTARLFRPGARWHSNIVTVFVDRAGDAIVRPTTQRMRATWIVEQLTRGAPMHQLLHAAGVSSMDALVRYEKFLPSVAP
ncbi:hypothetical protein RAC69_08540 [Microbacterium sp. LS_15]|uniref:hypothetical protein n=1 Tax=Microbacterium sp. LS_15 TaxID=3055790 RepID=UPI0035C03325